MRLHTALIVLPIVAVSAGCSPYLYKGEIDEFSKGVNQLAEASKISVNNANNAIANKHRWIWLDKRPLEFKLADDCPDVIIGTADTEDHDKEAGGISAGSLSPASEDDAQKTCGLIDSEKDSAKPYDFPKLKQIMKALQDYADSLAAITNAADREALDKAQATLKQSVIKLSGSPNQQSVTAKAAGPVADLFNDITTAMLDTRRYQALKAGVQQAQEPVRTLGGELGKIMIKLQNIQVQALRDTTKQIKLRLEIKQGRELDEGSYATRLDALQATVSALEALRSTKPEEVAKKMVEAHDKLATALEKNQGQSDAVIEATNTFLDSAKALREASATAAKSQKGSQ